jgi:hypothetical protein
MSVEFVKFSAHGAFFLWKKKDVLSHDWLLAGMIREPQMAMMSGDQFYVDVDPIALRFTYNVLQGIVQTSDLQNLSSMEMILIKNTAQYLLCPDVAQIIDISKNDLNSVKEENQKLFTKVKEMTVSQEISNEDCNKRIEHLQRELDSFQSTNRSLKLRLQEATRSKELLEKTNTPFRELIYKLDSELIMKQENNKILKSMKNEVDFVEEKNLKSRDVTASIKSEVNLLREENLKLKGKAISQENKNMSNKKIKRDLNTIKRKNIRIAESMKRDLNTIKRKNIRIVESMKRDINFLKRGNLRLKKVAASQKVLKMINEQLYQGLYRELVLMTKKKVILERKIRESVRKMEIFIRDNRKERKEIAERWKY